MTTNPEENRFTISVRVPRTEIDRVREAARFRGYEQLASYLRMLLMKDIKAIEAPSRR